MLNFTEFLAVAGLFVLRIGVPLLIMVGLVYLLKRLDRRWEADARAAQQPAKAAEQPAVQPAVQPQAPKPATVVRVPTQQPPLPWLPPPAVGQRPAQQPGLMAAPAAKACWDVKGCSESATGPVRRAETPRCAVLAGPVRRRGRDPGRLRQVRIIPTLSEDVT